MVPKKLNTLEQAWRWFGPDDPVGIDTIRQSGAEGVVTALHHIPNGEVWPEAAIREMQQHIAAHGLTWSVVESVPVHENIKQGRSDYQRYIRNFAKTIEHLGRAGIRTVCYNFMPVIDWTRTDLAHVLPDGSQTLAFSLDALAAFDIFMLDRPGAKNDYTPKIVEAATRQFESLCPNERNALESSIIAGLPGSEESYTRETLARQIEHYAGIDENIYTQNYFAFLHAVIPAAESSGVYLAVHPDDPPLSLFGLPRILSRLSQYQALFRKIPSTHNGMSLCTGSLGAGRHNDVEAFVHACHDRIHFLHLRNIAFSGEHDFYESGHIDGDLDIVRILSCLAAYLRRSGRRIPVRPDHGLRMLDDLKRQTRPGYAGIGRLKGLAEIRGMVSVLENMPSEK